MGYLRSVTYDLDFLWAGPAFDGLEATAEPVPVGVWMRMCALTGDGLEFTPENEAAVDEVLDIVGASLVSWNYQVRKDGVVTDLPPTAEGLRTLDNQAASVVVHAWQRALLGVAAPLDVPSPDGETPAVPIPMDPAGSTSPSS